MVGARLRFRLCPGCRRRFLEKYWRKDVSLALEGACRDFSDCPHFLLETTARVLRWRGSGSEQPKKKQTQQMVRIMPISAQQVQEQCCCFQLLPKDVLVQVLSYLPLRDLTTSRLVSKAWSAAASDPLLPPLCLQNGPPDDFQRSWLLLSHHDRFAALHPSSHRWLWFPFLVKVVDSAPWHSGYFLSAASNGLFCLLHQHCRNPRDGLLIGNPFTGRWRFVSPHPKLHSDDDSFLFVMSADPATGAYTLFFLVLHLVGKERVPSYTPLLYDSTTSTWHEWSPIFTNTNTKYFNVNSMVCNGVLVACAFEEMGLSVLQYDLHNHVWKEGWTWMPDLFWPDWHFIGDVGQPRLPTPVICQGRVFVAAKSLSETTSGGDRLKEECRLGRLPVVMHDPICIFELHRCDPLKLELVTDVPVDLLEKLVVDSLGTDFILTTDADGSEIWLMLEGTPDMLVYDLALQEWSLQGPGCPAEEITDPRHRTTVYSSLMWPCSV